MNIEDEMRIRRVAARIALCSYALAVIAVLFGLWSVATGDLNSATGFALSALMFLAAGIAWTFRTRGY